MDDRVLAEGGGAHEMVDGLAVDGEPGLAVPDHHTPVGVYPQQPAHVALLGLAVVALLTFSGEHGEHMVPWYEIRHAFPHTLHDPAIINLNRVRNDEHLYRLQTMGGG